MIANKYNLHETEEYEEWRNKQTPKDQVQIAKRLDKIKDEGYFGDHKPLDEGVWELKWQNGRRVYYAFIKELDILLLLGGNKNGQDKDITKAIRLVKNI